MPNLEELGFQWQLETKVLNPHKAVISTARINRSLYRCTLTTVLVPKIGTPITNTLVSHLSMNGKNQPLVPNESVKFEKQPMEVRESAETT